MASSARIARDDGFADYYAQLGLELSTDQLRLARTESGRARRLVQPDAHRLPFADATMDAVYAAFIHTDLDGRAIVIAEAARVVRPVGVRR